MENTNPNSSQVPAASTPDNHLNILGGQKKKTGLSSKQRWYIVGAVGAGLLMAASFFFFDLGRYLRGDITPPGVQDAYLYLVATPSTLSGANATSQVDVYLNTGSNPNISTVGAYLTYPTALLDVTQTQVTPNTTPPFDQYFINTIDNGSGQVGISVSTFAGNPLPPLGTNVLVGKFTVRAKFNSGSATINYDLNKSLALVNNRDNTDVLLRGDPVTLTIGNGGNSNANGNGNLNNNGNTNTNTNGNNNGNGNLNNNGNGNTNGNTNGNGNNNTNSTSVTLISLVPNQGPVGTAVVATGTGFTPSGNTVTFACGVSGNATVPNVTSANGTTLNFNVPAGLSPGACTVTVTNSNSQTSNALLFTVTSGGGGGGNDNQNSNTNTNGNGNGNGNSNLNGNLNNNNNGNTNANGNGNGNGNGNLNNNGNGNGNANTNSAPTLTNLNPPFGPVGTTVTATGTGFTPTGNTVQFACPSGNFIVQNLSSNNGTTLVFSVPGGISPAMCIVTITNTNGTTSGLPFTVTANTNTNGGSSSGGGSSGGGSPRYSHLACFNGQCVVAAGVGSDECSPQGSACTRSGGGGSNRSPIFSNIVPSADSVGNQNNPRISFEVTDPDGDDINRASVKLKIDGQDVTPVVTGSNDKHLYVSYQPTNLITFVNEQGSVWFIEKANAQSAGRRVYISLEASDTHTPPATGHYDYSFLIGSGEAPMCGGTTSPLSATTSGGNITLSWNASTDPNVTGYTIYIGESQNNLSRTEKVGKINTTTLSGFTIGHTYYFAVTATGNCRESNYSNMVAVNSGTGAVPGNFTPGSNNPAVPTGYNPGVNNNLPNKLVSTGPEMLGFVFILPVAYLIRRKFLKR